MHIKKYLLVLAILVIAGCWTKKSIYKLDPDIKEAGNYFSILKDCTKNKVLMDILDAKAYLAVTHKTWELRMAYIKELSQRKFLNLEEQKKLIEKQKKENDEYLSFIFILYTHNEKENDLIKANSVWNILLTNNKGEIVKPDKIDKLSTDEPEWHYFYPHMDDWSKIYEVRFLKKGISDKDLKWIKIIFAGIPSQKELKWALTF